MLECQAPDCVFRATWWELHNDPVNDRVYCSVHLPKLPDRRFIMQDDPVHVPILA